MRYLNKIFKLDDFVGKVLYADISDGIPCLFYFVTLKVYENMYEILKISVKFDNLDKMKTTSSESKVKMEVSGKWFVTALSLKTKARSTNYKKERYSIGNFSMKDLSKKIIEFENFVKVPHRKRHPNMNPL